jgi:ketosteroid isomerase-like protein
MKTLLPFLLILTACVKIPPDLSEPARLELIKADITMSALAGTEGFHRALLAFAHDSLIKPEEGRLPVIGKESLMKEWGSTAGSKEISWKPFRVEAAKSGDLGYTFGIWKMVTVDTSYYGNYFTAWKKDADGVWKWIVDGGSNTPVPKWTF